MANILTKSDITAYAPELDLSKYSDATISGMLSQATQRAAALANVDGFDLETVTNETDWARISNNGELQISVRRRPIVSVTSVNLIKGGFSTSLTLTDSSGNALYQIPTPSNKFVFPNSFFYLTGSFLAGGSSQLYTLRGARVMYQMTYVGGYMTPPDDLKFAVQLLFRDIFSKQFNTQQLASFTQGSYSESYGGRMADGLSALEKQAKNILMQGGYTRMEF